jgi:hypothetical protein
MTNKEKVINELKLRNGICDDCLSSKCGFEHRQAANQICRNLQTSGLIFRKQGECPICFGYKKVNILKQGEPIPETNNQKHDVVSRSWHWEGNVQSKIVDFLKEQGYTIVHFSDTASKVQGIDIKAKSPQGKLLWVTVKGYPEPDKHPDQQSRHWFSEAIFDVIHYHGRDQSVELGIGLPAGFQSYRTQLEKVSWLKDYLKLKIFLVSKTGEVVLEQIN